MTKLTIDSVMNLEPCSEYSREKVTEIFAGRESLNIKEVLSLEIPAQDRIWVVFNSTLLSSNEILECVCRIVEQQAFAAILEIGIEPDPRSVAAINSIRRFYRGEIDIKKMAAARLDALWAAIAAAKAAEGASWAAEAAGAAARAAAEGPSLASWAAIAAAKAAEGASWAWEQQLEIIKQFVDEREDVKSNG